MVGLETHQAEQLEARVIELQRRVKKLEISMAISNVIWALIGWVTGTCMLIFFR